MLQQWRAEQAKRKATVFARLLRRFVEDRKQAQPRWEEICDGPRMIYTRLSQIVDVHFAIHANGSVAVKCFPKGEDDAAT
jgi:hypothetical protein